MQTYTICYTDGTSEELRGSFADAKAAVLIRHPGSKIGDAGFAWSGERHVATIAAKRWRVNLTDVTPRRATVTSVRAASGSGEDACARDYAYVTEDMLPVVGERVWIADGVTSSGGARAITGRGPEVDRQHAIEVES